MQKLSPKFFDDFRVQLQNALTAVVPWFKLGLNAYFISSELLLCTVLCEVLGQIALFIGITLLFLYFRRRSQEGQNINVRQSNSEHTVTKYWRISFLPTGSFRVDGKPSLGLGPSVKLVKSFDNLLMLKGRFVLPGNALYASILTLVGLTVFMITVSTKGFGYAPGFWLLLFTMRLIRSQTFELERTNSESIVVERARSLIAVKGRYGIQPAFFSFKPRDFGEVNARILSC